MRTKVAIVSARTSRTHSSAERTELLAECDEVARACQDSRIELLDRLIDAPFKVVSHSRVADVEKAIDKGGCHSREAPTELTQLTVIGKRSVRSRPLTFRDRT